MTTRVGLYYCRAKRLPWVARWFGEYDPAKGQRRRYSKAFRLKRDAEAFQVSKQAELNSGGRRDAPVDMTVGAFCEKFVATCLRNHSHSDRVCYLNTINQLKAFLDSNRLLRLVDRQQAEEFISSRVRLDTKRKEKELSGWTRAQHVKHCRAMWRRACKWGLVAENVYDEVDAGHMATRPWHHITPGEFQLLLAVAPDARWRTVYWLLYGCGLRFGEAFNLTWADVDFENGRIHIRNRAATAELPPFVVKADGRGASSKERSVPMPKPVVDALTGWQGQAPEGVPFVLLTRERFEAIQRNWKRCQAGQPREGGLKPRPWQNRDMVNNMLRTIQQHARKAGISLTAPLTVHTFRKSFGQNHADHGTPIHVLQHLMGHSSITTTREFYIRVADANEQAAVKLYERLLAVQTADRPASRTTSDAKVTPASVET